MYHVLCLYHRDEERQFVSNALESYGLELTCVSRTAEAQAAMETTDFDLFVLDIRHLDGTGLDLIPRIRAKMPRAGIIILTSIDDETDRVLGLELGADDFLVSPVSGRELLARVKAILRRIRPDDQRHGTGPNAARQEMNFDGFVLRRDARSVRHLQSDRPIELTTLEFDLLTVLVQNRNKALSREQILKEIRGSAWEANDRFVDGLISRLRRKLHVDHVGESLIRTVRGVGYMLSD